MRPSCSSRLRTLPAATSVSLTSCVASSSAAVAVVSALFSLVVVLMAYLLTTVVAAPLPRHPPLLERYGL
ncbi:hypothetical protein D3C84_1142490 [compost metagenome]